LTKAELIEIPFGGDVCVPLSVSFTIRAMVAVVLVGAGEALAR
jgi:hypothetical protein